MRTALILTGGSGTRMLPITKTLNKGLVPINGLPALERIIRQLERSNIDRILVLAGQLSWQVEYFINNQLSGTNAEIIVSTTPPEYSPAERLLEASDKWIRSSKVILIYCDNLLQDGDISNYLKKDSIQKVFVQQRWSGNVAVRDSGEVNYSVNRKAELKYVDLGYWVLKPATFFCCLNKERDLPKALEQLTRVERIYPEIVDNYRTLSDLSRYTNERLKERKTVFLDRDGVIIEGVGQGQYVRKIEQVRFLENNLKFFSYVSAKYSIDFIVITNQAGVERNLVTMEEVTEINSYIAIKSLGFGVPILAFYVCPHHWDSNCQCRKPKPGMLLRAISDFKLDLTKTLIIGDRESDINSGINSGVQPFLITETMNDRERSDAYWNIIEFIEKLDDGQ